MPWSDWSDTNQLLNEAMAGASPVQSWPELETEVVVKDDAYASDKNDKGFRRCRVYKYRGEEDGKKRCLVHLQDTSKFVRKII